MEIYHFASDGSLISKVQAGYCQQYSNNVSSIFAYVDGITPSDYVGTCSFTPAGATSSITLLMSVSTQTINGVSKKGYILYLPSSVTQIAGAMEFNIYITSTLGTVLVSQVGSIYVNASSGTEWDTPINYAQWQELVNYIIAFTPDTTYFVTLGGDQTIDGVKTFSSPIKGNELDDASGNKLVYANGTNNQFGNSSKPFVVNSSVAPVWGAKTFAFTDGTVNLSGDQSVSGNKTFSGNIAASKIGSNAYYANDLSNVLMQWASSSLLLGNNSCDTPRIIGIHKPQWRNSVGVDSDLALVKEIPYGTPTVIAETTPDALCLAGGDAYFNVTGAGTLANPYVISPKTNIVTCNSIFEFAATSGTNAYYIQFKQSTHQKCVITLLKNDLCYYMFIDYEGHPRYVISDSATFTSWFREAFNRASFDLGANGIAGSIFEL